MLIKIIPKFRTRTIINKTIRRYWNKYQIEAVKMGEKLHKDIVSYVNANAKKRSGNTGNLARSINFEFSTLGKGGTIFWGIGNLNLLNQNAPQWYVLNYGKTVAGIRYIPNYGNFVPGYFSDGRPQSSKRGAGKASFYYRPNEASADRPGDIGGMYPKTPITPINYIQFGQQGLARRARYLLAKLKRQGTAV